MTKEQIEIAEKNLVTIKKQLKSSTYFANFRAKVSAMSHESNYQVMKRFAAKCAIQGIVL